MLLRVRNFRFSEYRPDWYEALMKIKDAYDQPGEQEAIQAIYQTMEKGPTEDVTRFVMDSGEAVVILLPFKNTDVGTWESVREFSADDNENHFDANVVAIDTTGTLVKAQNSNKLIAVAGLKDMVVVDSEDALLAFVLIAPAGAIHHPEERRLDPRHALHLERRRHEGAMLKCAIGDGV